MAYGSKPNKMSMKLAKKKNKPNKMKPLKDLPMAQTKKLMEKYNKGRGGFVV